MKIKGLILLLALLSIRAPAQSDTILWGVHDLPPLQITSGKHANQGIYDGVLDFIKSKMPEYKHETRRANAKRFWQWIKQKEQFCYVASIPNPERLQHAYYSMANGFHVSNFVVISKAAARSMALTNSVSLKKLLQNKRLAGGAVAARSYGKDADQIIQQYKQDNFRFYVSGNLGLNVYQMLLGNRMDYIIEYPFVIEYFNQVLDADDQTISLMIEEAPPFSMGHTACPKSPWGRKIIDKVNQIYRQHRGSKEYRKLMERWQNETTKKRIRENYQLFLDAGELATVNNLVSKDVEE